MPESKQDQTSESEDPAWIRHPFFKYAVGILLVLLIIFLLSQTTSVWKPIVDFISILSAPVVISFLFYYLLRPLIRVLERFYIPRFIGILLVYFVFGVLLFLFFAYLVPLLVEQVAALVNISVEKFEEVRESSQSFLSRFFGINIDYEIQKRLLPLAQRVTETLSKNLLDFLGYITRIATILAVIPFIVFYLLKDDQDFSTAFLRYVPEDFDREVRKILRNMDETLSDYINGLVLVSLSVGTLLFIGYLIIGLNYALILSLIALVLTSIPYLGPFLAITPALLVALSGGFWMIAKVILTFVVVQQLESNLITPQVIGQRLHIHPLTLILLLLAAGSLYGLVGLILATPLYALLKVLIENFYKIYRLRYLRMKSSSKLETAEKQSSEKD